MPDLVRKRMTGDLRLIVAGGRVVGAIERHAPTEEWRTNVALGGTRHPLRPADAARVLALRATAAVRGDLVGVDLLRRRDGRYIMLEVNGAVDFTTEYGVDDCNPLEAAVDALLATVDPHRRETDHAVLKGREQSRSARAAGRRLTSAATSGHASNEFLSVPSGLS